MIGSVSLVNGECISLLDEMQDDDFVHDLRRHVAHTLEENIQHVTLLCNYVELEDNRPLSDFGNCPIVAIVGKGDRQTSRRVTFRDEVTHGCDIASVREIPLARNRSSICILL
mmetsp:Transcript_70696/g.196645  ORF Transcript_70696/g.196645 Transcript_70696/m.196645 type:complete len:113 (-) Transcript_70696:207-545(-)